MAIRYRIATKIFALAVFLLTLTVCLSVFGTWKTRQLRLDLDQIASQYLPLHETLDDVDTYCFERQIAFEKRLGLLSEAKVDPSEIAEAEQNYDDNNGHVAVVIAAAEQQISALLGTSMDQMALSQLRGNLEQVKEQSHKLESLQTRILDHRNLRNRDLEKQFRELHRDEKRNLDKYRDEMTELIDDLTKQATQSAAQREVRLMWVTVGITAGAVAFGLLFAWMVTRRMVQPVRVLMTGIQSVEQGDLSIQVPVGSTDEIGVLTGSFNKLVSELRSKERMKETFGKYIDPRIVEKVILNPSAAETEGGKRVMTVSFCDLVGFTGISENLAPTGLVRLLNRHFALVADAIHAYQGVLDKFMGDAVMAFWGPPFTTEDDHAVQACRSALAQLRVLETLRLELPELTGMRRNIPVVDLRVGLASGEVVVGNIGAEQARAYTVIGDTVNLASRLESINRLYGTRILISDETRRLAGEMIEVREIDWIAVKGRTEPATIYELVGLGGEVVKEKLDVRDRYAEGLAAYRKADWAAAEAALRGVIEIAPQDGPSRELQGRIARLRADSQPAWDGVWHAIEK